MVCEFLKSMFKLELHYTEFIKLNVGKIAPLWAYH